MKNESNKYFRFIYIIYILFWFFGFSVAFFALTFMIRTILSVGFLLYDQAGLLGIIFILLFAVFFVISFFPVYLLVRLAYTRFYKLFPVSEKYKEYVKIFLYSLNYILGLFIFNKMVADFDNFFKNTIIIYIITFILILAVDFLCDKIYLAIKNKFRSKK
ncbi:MAG: hypothetical protein COT67_00415 [Candidatus Tagabacteria bacterium CG09_land_8_20_14_0_10_41_14]|uniref:Uncharacterized protein n=1 Tax=Candidatus Tagabacteria bacterium CG09_land_8_20_14_0_10_41_14 TaxID=1975021 RepID=A0A2H0WP19_9BACT|nr:MAG: hypothetical protein COT67_00415 [Candidatus Tagabacteria bacterium CG09_land_8_20_14_0_10_41_14]